MQVIRKIKEDKKIVINGVLDLNGQRSELSIIGELGGMYDDKLLVRFFLSNKNNEFTGNTSSLKFWSVYDKNYEKNYTYMMPSWFSDLLQEQSGQIKIELGLNFDH